MLQVYERSFYDHINSFKLKFENGSEFVKRLEIFSNNFDAIEKHNADASQTYKLDFHTSLSMSLLFEPELVERNLPA